MGKKKSSGTNYVSKGQRRNVSRKTRNMMRAEKRANPPVRDVLKRMEHRDKILNTPKGAAEKQLRERYLQEDYVHIIANKLFDQYREVNITWAACVQAAKTNFSEQLHFKWGPKLKAYNDEKNKGSNK